MTATSYTNTQTRHASSRVLTVTSWAVVYLAVVIGNTVSPEAVLPFFTFFPVFTFFPFFPFFPLLLSFEWKDSSTGGCRKLESPENKRQKQQTLCQLICKLIFKGYLHIFQVCQWSPAITKETFGDSRNYSDTQSTVTKQWRHQTCTMN